ncbi:hypothetical protein ACF0H5_023102 [Mactra antiquata]
MNFHIIRRKYRVLFLIAIVGTIYLCFQIFSFKVLNFTSQKEMHHKARQNSMVFEDIEHNIKEVSNDNVAEFNQKTVDNDKDLSSLPRGVHVSMSEMYLPDSRGKFKCHNSKIHIPFVAVNDDYCDCPDSSDEPGTSACLESKFYCTFQNPDIEPQYIPGSRVNDGVCDCCDGSDEWNSITVFSGVQLTDKRMKGSLSHAPCKDDCSKVLKENEEDAKIRSFGKRLRQTYLEAAKKISNKQDYGPNGVFYKLSLECFEFDSVEYKYKLCPFHSVTQQAFPNPPTDIGKVPVWKVKLPGHYALKMDKGDASRCPYGKTRSTVINFICGLTDKIIKVSEEEKCTYSIRFSTPAAC